MLTRLGFVLLVLASVSAFSQAPRIAQQIGQRTDAKEQQLSQVVAPQPPDPAAARLQAIHEDAQQLYALSASVQSDLQLLGKGMLSKDMDANLKKMEKLAKRLRQEMNP